MADIVVMEAEESRQTKYVQRAVLTKEKLLNQIGGFIRLCYSSDQQQGDMVRCNSVGCGPRTVSDVFSRLRTISAPPGALVATAKGLLSGSVGIDTPPGLATASSVVGTTHLTENQVGHCRAQDAETVMTDGRCLAAAVRKASLGHSGGHRAAALV